MRRYVYLICKIFILFGMFLLVFSSLNIEKDSKASMETVLNKTVSNINLNGMEKQDNLAMKRFLNLDPSQYKSCIYYKIDDAMQASEFVIVQFKDHSQQEAFQKTIQTRIENQKGIFEGYAPKQADLLKNAIIDIQGNYALYVVKDDAKTMDSQFLSALNEEK